MSVLSLRKIHEQVSVDLFMASVAETDFAMQSVDTVTHKRAKLNLALFFRFILNK